MGNGAAFDESEETGSVVAAPKRRSRSTWSVRREESRCCNSWCRSRNLSGTRAFLRSLEETDASASNESSDNTVEAVDGRIVGEEGRANA